MKIDDSIIQRLAGLARLEFNAEDSKQIEADLGRILGFVDKLRELDTRNVEPLVYMSDEVNVLRPDEPFISITHEEALSNAPKKDSDFFKVPKVIE